MVLQQTVALHEKYLECPDNLKGHKYTDRHEGRVQNQQPHPALQNFGRLAWVVLVRIDVPRAAKPEIFLAIDRIENRDRRYHDELKDDRGEDEQIRAALDCGNFSRCLLHVLEQFRVSAGIHSKAVNILRVLQTRAAQKELLGSQRQRLARGPHHHGPTKLVDTIIRWIATHICRCPIFRCRPSFRQRWQRHLHLQVTLPVQLLRLHI
mmetsp:Transcript_21477/g.52890  ORF Transcript_21477/g.52890 Transcript_21477/m.52890 type:complete len:208 (+) Transcript_21477:2630-3253(+)